MAFTRAWDESTPTDSNYIWQVDDFIRELRVDVRERLGAMFYGFSNSETSLLPHAKYVRFISQTSDPSASGDDEGFLLAKSVGGKAELHWVDASANVKQITTAGKLAITTDDIATVLIDEDDLASASRTRPPTQGSVKAYVDSGTVKMTNKTLTSPVLNNPELNGDLSGDAILDEDDFASNSDTKVPTQQSTGAYIASQKANCLGTPTTLDSLGNTLARNYVYKVGSAGLVVAFGDVEYVRLYIGQSSSPGTLLNRSEGIGSYRNTVGPIPKDWYWKVTADGSVVIFWIPFGSGACVRQS